MSKADAQVRRYRIFQILSLRDDATAMTETEVYEALVAEGYNVSQKTVQRDLTQNMDQFKLLETETYPNKYYADKESYNPNIELALTKDKLFAVVIALNSLKKTSPAPIEKLCDETLVTIGDSIPEELQETYNYFKLVSQTQEGVGGRSVAQDDESFEEVFHAIIDGKAFECKISSPLMDQVQQNRIRKFYPVFFTFTNNIPYLYAQDLDSGDFKQLRMTRLTAVKLINDIINRKTLEKKARKEIKNSFSGFSGGDLGLLNYEIYCDKKMATHFEEKQLCSSQKIERILEDKYRITFKLNSNHQIIRLLAGFGGHIESIRPKKISDEVLAIWNKSYKKAA